MAQIDMTVLLAAVLQSQGGEIFLPTEAYNAMANTENLGLGFDLIDEGSVVRLYLTEVEPNNDIIIPSQ